MTTTDRPDPLVMIVHSQEDMCQLYEAVFEGAGYSTCRASSAREVSEALAAGARPALILLHAYLPDTDVGAFVRALKADRATAAPIFLLSPTPVDAAALGADEAFWMPISLPQVVETAARYCRA